METPSRPRILVVDDEEAILETMVFTFEDDYEVVTAADARRALELLDQRAPIATVLTDQRMPGMTGVEFLALVYARHPETTRIILTGFADMDAIVKAINDGHVYAYVTKPWEPDHLKQVVRRAVELHALQCQNQRLLSHLRSSQVLLQAVMDQLGTGAIAVDPGGIVQATNRPACAFLGCGVDPVGRSLDDVLGTPGLAALREAVLRLDDGGDERFEEVPAKRGDDLLQLRVVVKTLHGPTGEQLGRVLLLREISHEPLRRELEDVVQALVAAGDDGLRDAIEHATPELRRIADCARASRIDSPGMSELAERASRTVTALENWISVDDAMAAEAYPDAQLLLDRMRVARARWPLGDELPGRVRELARRVEAYYESGENAKQRTL